MTHYKELNINLDPFINLPDHYYSFDSIKDLVWNKYIEEVDLDPSIHSWFQSHGLQIFKPMIFGYRGNSKSLIHRDGYDDRVYSAINFSKGPGSIEWYRLTDDVKGSGPKSTNIAGSPHEYYQYSQCVFLEKCNLEKPVLIDVNTPHRGINPTEHVRYSITLRWKPRMTFEESCNLFIQYLTN